MISSCEKYLGRLCKRGHDHNGTGKSLRAKSSNACMLCKAEANVAYRAKVAENRPSPRVALPVMRDECPETRPCMRTTCRYHLSDDIEDWRERSCALDYADAGPMTMEEVASVLGVTRQRVDQIQKTAMRKLFAARKILAEFREEDHSNKARVTSLSVSPTW